MKTSGVFHYLADMKLHVFGNLPNKFSFWHAMTQILHATVTAANDIVRCTMAIATEGASVMKHFSETPEAVDFIASQAWLSPDEPAARIVGYTPKKRANRRIGPGQAIREIAGILRRTRISARHYN